MSIQENQELEKSLTEALPGVSADRIGKIIRFRELILAESERQNLTRLLNPREFLEGHVLDVRELLKSGFLSFPAMDLGSGAGVPGLLAAILGTGPWVLAESEVRKAQFLAGTAQALGLEQVRVIPDRAESILKKEQVESVVVRAVGPIERIYNWIRPCSTWNSLVLLKGPGWEKEWDEFQKTAKGRELKTVSRHDYTIGEGSTFYDYPKKRVVIRLERVLRGTKKN